MILSINHLIKDGSDKLKNISDSPKLDAEILLSFILKISRFDLLLKGHEEVDKDLTNKFNTLIQRRMSFEPVAYIINERPFFEDVFYVDNRVLIPRPETEFLVTEGVNHLKKYEKRPSVLDICCGSGCVGLSILRVIDCKLTMSDVSERALDVAGLNAQKLFEQNSNIKLIKSDLFENITEKYDVITANPPYLSTMDMAEFAKEDLKYEPVNALFGGEKGFEITEKILDQAHGYLNPGGIIAIELGFEGSYCIKEFYQNIKLEKIIKDYSNIDRVAVFSLCRQ